MENKKISLMAGIKKYGQTYVKYLILAAIFSLIGSVATVIGPSQLSKITNLISAGLHSAINVPEVFKITVILAIIYIVGAIFNYFQGFIIATVTQKFTQGLRSNISSKINRLPLKYFDTHDQGDTLSRVTNDLDTLRQSLNQSLGTVISSTLLIVGSIVMMLITNWILTLTAVIAVLIGFALTILIMMRSQKYFNNQQNGLANVSGFLEETYSGQTIVKTYNDTDNASKKFDQLNNNLYDNVWKSQFLSGIMQPLMNFIGNFGYVAVVIVGSILVLNHVITIGVVVAFIVFVRIFT